MSEDYYIYIAEIDGKAVYVGKGKGDRLKHLTSGRSHVLEANRRHFLGEPLTVFKIYEGLSEREALVKEAGVIKKHDPAWNILKCSRDTEEKMDIAIKGWMTMMKRPLGPRGKRGTLKDIAEKYGVSYTRLLRETKAYKGVKPAKRLTQKEFNEVLKDNKVLSEEELREKEERKQVNREARELFKEEIKPYDKIVKTLPQEGELKDVENWLDKAHELCTESGICGYRLRNWLYNLGSGYLSPKQSFNKPGPFWPIKEEE